MKKMLSLMLVLVMVMGCVGFIACGGGESEPTPSTPAPSSSSETPTPPAEEPAPASSSGITWDDMPVYSGAKQAQKGAWAIPPSDGDWSKVEWRYYETGDSTDAVASFYKSQMPGKGWTEMGWMEVQGMAWGFYAKNGEEDGAMFWCGSEEGKNFFALMRATK